jgi:hypothetical protein
MAAQYSVMLFAGRDVRVLVLDARTSRRQQKVARVRVTRLR